MKKKKSKCPVFTDNIILLKKEDVLFEEEKTDCNKTKHIIVFESEYPPQETEKMILEIIKSLGFDAKYSGIIEDGRS